EHEEVDDGRPQRDVEQRVPRGGHGPVSYEPSSWVPSDPRRGSAVGHAGGAVRHAAPRATGPSWGGTERQHASSKPRGAREVAHGAWCFSASEQAHPSEGEPCVSHSTSLPPCWPR